MERTTNQERNMNANQEYNRKMENLQDLAEALEDAIAEHERRQIQDPLNWGFAGDLDYATDKLLQALAALGDEKAQEQLEKAGRF